MPNAAPTLIDMANAVAEMASLEITVVEGMKAGTWAPCDPDQRRAIEWRATCLVAAHRELRSMIRLRDTNAKARRVG